MVEFSGDLDASTFETVPLNPPFSSFGMPITAEVEYSLSPADFRTNDGSGFGFGVSSQEKNVGFEVQFSSPSNFFFSSYSSYVPIDQDNVQVQRHDWAGTWAPGTLVARLTIDGNLVPRLYFDGVESPLIDGGPAYDYFTTPGNYSNIYAYSVAPGQVVTIERFKMVRALIPPPTPF